MLAALSSRSEDEIFLIAHRYITQGLQMDPEQMDPQQQSNLDATLSSRTTN